MKLFTRPGVVCFFIWMLFTLLTTIAIGQKIQSDTRAHSHNQERQSLYFKRMIAAPPDSLQLDPFYKKYCNALGIPVVSSANTPDAALLTARDIIGYMLAGRQDIRNQLVKAGARVLIMAEQEMETDLPEHSQWKKPAPDDARLTPGERANYNQPGGIASMTDKQYWNQRARGMGGLITSCAEENLLGYQGTRYYGENIFVHEFSHNMMGAIKVIDTALYNRIIKAYQSAKAKGMYKDEYAINTADEYWAEGTQWWFWSNIEFFDTDKGVRLQTPDELKKYDPELYNILSTVYIGHHIPADVYYGKNLHPVQHGSD